MVELLEAWCFQGVKEIIFLFFCFSFVLLFSRLLWRDLGEMVSVMECDHGCSMEILYELCESCLCEWISEEISGEQRDGEKYMMLAKVKSSTFWRGDEAKFLDFMMTNKCGVDFRDLDCNQLRAKVDLDFWLS
jgi:hypothetical protein